MKSKNKERERIIMAMTEGDIEEAGGDDYLLPKARRVRQLRG